MSIFIARVQFSSENKRFYTILRDNLLKIGFTKKIKSKEGIEYFLPNGNYLLNSDYDIETIIKEVKKIAFKIERSPFILISKVEENVWVNLEKV